MKGAGPFGLVNAFTPSEEARGVTCKNLKPDLNFSWIFLVPPAKLLDCPTKQTAVFFKILSQLLFTIASFDE
jgi:hypothetical protein